MGVWCLVAIGFWNTEELSPARLSNMNPSPSELSGGASEASLQYW